LSGQGVTKEDLLSLHPERTVLLLSRCSFLTESAALGVLPALLANADLAHAVTAATTQDPSAPTAGEIDWKSLYSSGSDAATRGKKVEVPNEEREPRFIRYSDGTGMRWIEDIKATELPSFSQSDQEEAAIIARAIRG
jgi:hypothetical protein